MSIDNNEINHPPAIKALFSVDVKPSKTSQLENDSNFIDEIVAGDNVSVERTGNSVTISSQGEINLDHNLLSNRDLSDQHPINSITNLQNSLDSKQNLLTEEQLQNISDVTNKADKATTLSGYGIIDAYTKEEIDNKLNNKQNSQNIITDTSSTSVILDNAVANTVYHYGVIDNLTIQSVDTSDLETIIWFTPSENMTNITLPDSIEPINNFTPVSGKLTCVSILNNTIVYGSVL